MSATAITLILIAAVAHASWNLFSKQAAQTGAISFIWLAATAATLLYIPGDRYRLGRRLAAPHRAGLGVHGRHRRAGVGLLRVPAVRLPAG